MKFSRLANYLPLELQMLVQGFRPLQDRLVLTGKLKASVMSMMRLRTSYIFFCYGRIFKTSPF